MGVFDFLKPQIPSIDDISGVVKWFWKYDKAIRAEVSALEQILPDVAYSLVHNTVISYFDTRTYSTTESRNLGKTFSLHFAGLKAALQEHSMKATDPDLEAEEREGHRGLCLQSVMSLRILGYFLREKYGIDPERLV